jgi:hypothetical protein
LEVENKALAAAGQHVAGRFLFVSGLSGSGKTTLGESLKTKSSFVHFNVDVWAFGGDPVLESEAVPGPDMMKKMNPDTKAAFDAMAAGGFKRLAAGEETEWGAWEGFFSRLCPAVIAARAKCGPSQNFVVTFSVYLRSVRDYLRKQLGDELAFVVLNPSIENVGLRKVQHLRNTASGRGQTLSQFLLSFHPGSGTRTLQPSLSTLNLVTFVLVCTGFVVCVGDW